MSKEPIFDGVIENENVLEDDYPVHFGYLYVCDSKVKNSPIGGGKTVADLKKVLDCKEVRRCNIIGRNIR
jgi:hypothetical protein